VRKLLADRCEGRCEKCGGNGFPFGLHPHEKKFRSHGGEMTLENSTMLCQVCHAKEHGRIEISGNKERVETVSNQGEKYGNQIKRRDYFCNRGGF
jgi:5-methylcytosine-specific restriction endonuclease McrA